MNACTPPPQGSLAHHVTQCGGTEPAFTGPWLHEKRKGRYLCTCCGQPLFTSEAKFDSGSGWPSFFEPLDRYALTQHRDASHGMVRVEVRCSGCQAHLGHVFTDGPAPTGLRYCINGVALQFDPSGDNLP
jgi:peptide-methionine (R)-S-oxide reductase